MLVTCTCAACMNVRPLTSILAFFRARNRSAARHAHQTSLLLAITKDVPFLETTITLFASGSAAALHPENQRPLPLFLQIV